MRTTSDFNKYVDTAARKADSMFANSDSFNYGLGSGLSSLLQFFGLGGLGSVGVRGGAKLVSKSLLKKFPKRTASLVGHMGGGMPLNAGEIYSMAKQDGLDDDDAAALSLVVGFINTIIEYGVGTNALANRAFGISGSRSITFMLRKFYKSIFLISFYPMILTFFMMKNLINFLNLRKITFSKRLMKFKK